MSDNAYKKNGDKCLALYSKDGDIPHYAYDINGEVIWENKYYSFTDTVLYSTPGGNQGFDISDGKIAQFLGTNYTIKLIGLGSGSTTNTIPSGIAQHGNDVSFMPFKYDETDPLPILYVENHALRLNPTDNTATEVYTIRTPHGDGHTSWVNYGSAFNGNTLYTIGYSTTYTDTNSLVFLEKWDISENIEYPTLISQVTRPWVVCIQGATYYDGMLWCSCGIGNQSTGAHLYAFNPDDGSIVYDIVLDHHNELEGIAWVNENGEDFIVYGTWNGSYHKVTFN